MTCNKYSLNQLGVLFQIKLIECTSGTPFDVDDIDTVSIIFYKPDGIRFEKPATLVEDLPDNSGEFFIQYHNTTDEESIFDLIGSWEFAGAAVLTNGDNLEANVRTVFWVS